MVSHAPTLSELTAPLLAGRARLTTSLIRPGRKLRPRVGWGVALGGRSWPSQGGWWHPELWLLCEFPGAHWGPFPLRLVPASLYDPSRHHPDLPGLSLAARGFEDSVQKLSISSNALCAGKGWWTPSDLCCHSLPSFLGSPLPSDCSRLGARPRGFSGQVYRERSFLRMTSTDSFVCGGRCGVTTGRNQLHN